MWEFRTIAAIASPAGEGAIAIIRISGPQSFEILEKIFSKPLKQAKTHTAHYGTIFKEDRTPVDQVLVLIMRGPKSYTGEDTIEIFCHGGSLITQQVFQTVLQAGALPAHPGEFSLKAYQNKKIDLAQAEAIQALIGAKNELALKMAERQLEGALSEKIAAFQRGLIDAAAILEAWVDFPEEDLEFTPFEEMIGRLHSLCEEMKLLQATFHEGKTIHQGLKLCLLGSPNVGKSSLMNALLGTSRAIVTDIPGTTRDLIEEDLKLGQLHFKLIDTAGIRHTLEPIEQEGILRSKQAMEQADLILLVLDASAPLSPGDLELIETSPKEKTILVWNKMDIAPTDRKELPSIEISAKKRWGLEELKKAIDQKIWKKGAPSKEELVITHLRHFQALSEAILFCEKAIDGLQKDLSAEFIVADVRAALNHLGVIIGQNVTEEILSSIFSQFCLGK